jgi:hypothetical protein
MRWKWQRTQRFDATEDSQLVNNLALPLELLTPSGERLIVSFGAVSSGRGIIIDGGKLPPKILVSRASRDTFPT